MSQAQIPEKPIMLVDDESDFLFSLAMTLRAEGLGNVIKCSDAREVIPIVEEKDVSLILLDINMPHISGRDLLKELSSAWPDIPVINLTAIDDVETAVECMRTGAFDYVVKPVDDTRLITTIRKALDYRQMKDENVALKKYFFVEELLNDEPFSHIVTESEKMNSIFRYIEAIAGTEQPILITGETGTGKELIAQAVHKASGAPGEFVAVNVAGVDDSYFADTLFGHEKGAFTGADRTRKGLIETAEGGTLFLDEIGDLATESQVKLLRMLQEKQYYRIGSDRPRPVKCRIVVATHQNLEKHQREGRFRKDLYYRLLTHHIKIPALRERMEDIPVLLDHFLEKAAQMMNKKKPAAPRELYTLLKNHSFPGNIRELESMVIDAVGRHMGGILSMTSFKEKIFVQDESGPVDQDIPGEEIVFPEKFPTLKEMEEMMIEEAFRRTDGNQTLAAELLGISRRALNNRLMRKK